MVATEYTDDVIIISYLLNLVMFEDCKNQWSVSRPLLGLIVVQYEFYMQIRRQIVTAAPAIKQAQYNQCFENLMAGVEQQLSTKNRDKFTQNLAVFRRDLNTFAKTPSAGDAAGAAAAASSAVASPFGGGGAAAAASPAASRFGAAVPQAAHASPAFGVAAPAAAFGGGAAAAFGGGGGGGGGSAMDS